MKLKIYWECKDLDKKGAFDADWPHSLMGAEFFYNEGNGSCDCNLSVSTQLDDWGKPWPCGDRIKVTKVVRMD